MSPVSVSPSEPSADDLRGCISTRMESGVSWTLMARQMAAFESSHKPRGAISGVDGNQAATVSAQRKMCVLPDRQHDGSILS